MGGRHRQYTICRAVQKPLGVKGMFDAENNVIINILCLSKCDTRERSISRR